MNLKKIEEVTEPEVGARYLVRCGEVFDHPQRFNALGVMRMKYVPLLGPIHEDKEVIGFRDYHYHVDWRFVTPRGYSLILRHKEREVRYAQECRGPIANYSAEDLLLAIAVVGGQNMVIDRPTRYRPMVMFREAAVFPSQVSWIFDLERKFATARLRSGLICPHRGISCAGVKTEGNVQTVVCPGHGLAWNRETGELVRRTREARHSKTTDKVNPVPAPDAVAS